LLPSQDEIREILAKRIDQQKQATAIVLGTIDRNGRRVVAYGNPAKDDPRSVDGDTIFEIGAISIFKGSACRNSRHIRRQRYTHGMVFRVIIERDPETGDYSAICPELPGCASAGSTEDEARANIAEAIELYLSPGDIPLPDDAKLVEVTVG
jgi:predicted RNase H-like HicB family nuclease